MNASSPHDPAELTLAAIAPVRDATARRTLEQVEALVAGLRRAERLGVAPVPRAEAETLAREALELIARMADRDAKADEFHAAVRVAGQSERALRGHLDAVLSSLRAVLGPSGPELADLGVPAEDPVVVGRRPARDPGPLWSTSTVPEATAAELLPELAPEPETPPRSSG